MSYDDIIWVESSAADAGAPRVEQLNDDPTALLFSDGVPDWVRIPNESPIYAGEKRRVHDHRRQVCPHEDCERVVIHMTLLGPGELQLAACADHGWSLYQYRH